MPVYQIVFVVETDEYPSEEGLKNMSAVAENAAKVCVNLASTLLSLPEDKVFFSGATIGEFKFDEKEQGDEEIPITPAVD